MELSLNIRSLTFLCVLPCLGICSVILNSFGSTVEPKEAPYSHHNSRTLLEVTNDSLIQCIPSGIDSFPTDFFTQEQRQKGGVIVHVIIAIYTCVLIGEVCYKYFVPSLEMISERLKLPPDIAGATFMAIGTSAPELFSSITGSFITEGDIGVGTVIGSAVFNMVGVTGLVGIVIWNEELSIDWYPIARDSAAYALTVSTLIWIIFDNIVEWWEALVLVTIFFLYIIVICYNQKFEKWSIDLMDSIQHKYRCCRRGSLEETNLLSGKIFAPEITESQNTDKWLERDSYSVEVTASKERDVLQKEPIQYVIDHLISNEIHKGGTLWSSPSHGGWRLLWWVFMYPGRLLLFLSIPDSSQERFRKFFPVTFVMSVLWIGVLSYLAVWMVTVIGYTATIPDSVSGLTILAAGTSVPEVISSIIVAKNGLGNMAISNLIGSNTFDIAFCLGVPWLIKSLMDPKKYMVIFSSAFTYTTTTLLIFLMFFITTFVMAGWKLNRRVGLIFCLLYSLFVVLACMYELNVFGKINAEICS